MAKSIEFSLEEKLMEALKAAINDEIPVIGLIGHTNEGFLKEQDLTSVQVRVYNLTQPHEALPLYEVSAEVRLNVEQAETANGGLFTDMHEAIALYLQQVMLGDNCVALSTDECFVDGLQRGGGDANFDVSGGEWFATWNMTLTGRLKQEEN